MIRLVVGFVAGYLAASGRGRTRKPKSRELDTRENSEFADISSFAAETMPFETKNLVTAHLKTTALGQAFDETYIWVAEVEDNDTEIFNVRQYGPTPATIDCFSDDINPEARGNWTIISRNQLSLPRCLDRNSPTVSGFIYELRRSGR